MTREIKRLTLTVTSHTLVGGSDNPNCFSLARTPSDWNGVRIVNMQLGPFDRVVASGLLTDDVEAELITPGRALLIDSRIPAHELHNDRWCTVCTPFAVLPVEQQRDFLRRYQPHIRDGRLTSWGAQSGVTHDDATIDQYVDELRAIGYIP